MTASYNISFLGSPEQAESQKGKKGYRSSRYNNYMVEVVDFDNESHTFEVDARSEAEASEQAADMAMAAGLQVSWLRPKSAALGIVKTSFAIALICTISPPIDSLLRTSSCRNDIGGLFTTPRIRISSVQLHCPSSLCQP